MVDHPRTRLWTVVATIALLAVPAVAQGKGQVAAEYRRSREALRDYHWKSRVETSVNGEVTGTRLYEVGYSAEGALTRTLIEDEGKKKASKFEEQAGMALAGIRRLIDAYMHMKPEQMQKMFGDGTQVREADEEGWTRVRSRDVFAQGDTVNLWVDPTDFHLRKAEIQTSMQQQPCRLVAEFEDIEYGPTIAVRSVFEMEAMKKKKPAGKTIVVVTENFDYQRR